MVMCYFAIAEDFSVFKRLNHFHCVCWLLEKKKFLILFVKNAPL